MLSTVGFECSLLPYHPPLKARVPPYRRHLRSYYVTNTEPETRASVLLAVMSAHLQGNCVSCSRRVSRHLPFVLRLSVQCFASAAIECTRADSLVFSVYGQRPCKDKQVACCTTENGCLLPIIMFHAKTIHIGFHQHKLFVPKHSADDSGRRLIGNSTWQH